MKHQAFTNCLDYTLDVTDTGGGMLMFGVITDRGAPDMVELDRGEVEKLRDALTCFLEENK